MGGCFSGGSSGPSGYRSKFKRDAVKAHNRYRSMHGAPNIKLNGNISKYAQEWANKLAKEGQLQHRSEHKYGENIYYGADSRGLDELTGDKAVKSFYDEINRYNFNSGGFSSGTGHFTQVVWKDSRRLGIGVAVNPRKQNEVFAVFNYDPPGNVSGRYKENVLPSKKR
ncbi:Golgi-associated plant pathogenesis-related protein 1-like [Acanthaster planci]|uniref:Golgi-associated plant pathogenesis-related protein 1-like n=1 Tax=Acanthaster planci TaxID=133434 RepID=A0A8B7YCA3_ACAPL|nr:Golgi-associated plant pathogenesis-related protein 1-like [Acanthaster planci]